MKKKNSITQVIRHIVQLSAFILFPGLFITIFAAIRDIYMAVISGSFHFSVYADQLLLIVAVFPITILFGRFFCGYLCSFGAMGDLLWWVSSKIIKRPIFDRASNSIIPNIIDTQSVEVDAVSGATFSSNGIIEAVADALHVSFSNPNNEKPQKEHRQKGNGYGRRPGFLNNEK